MRRSGFTMIELIFVIVILGILAAVALPRMAATRDDATAASVKADVGTAIQAVPAWYQGQRDVRIAQSMTLDPNVWERTSDISYAYDDGGTCVTLEIWDMNLTAGTGSAADSGMDFNATNGRWIRGAGGAVGDPVLRVVQGTAATGPVCDIIWNQMDLPEQNITMGGNRVQW